MGSYSFPKNERLLKRASFLKLSRFGRKIQTRYFIAAIQDAETDRTRIGITVSKRVGNAVERTRIKRIVREYYRKNRDAVTGNRDINIIARKYAAPLSNGEVRDELGKLFKKIVKFDG
ncbi:MAG: ribonuclease P protein component [Desulfobacterales bacterium]|nr:ribonuclease P protein component [Desulfobacterales bacterium]